MNSSFNKYPNQQNAFLSFNTRWKISVAYLVGQTSLQNQSFSAPKPLIPFTEILKPPSSKELLHWLSISSNYVFNLGLNRISANSNNSFT